MGWLNGILSGYADRQGEIRKENAARDEDAAKQEAAIYSSLLDHPDPNIQAMAATGIFQMGQGRQRATGFDGWMGKMQSSPVFATLQKYMTTPQPVTSTTTTPGLPSTQFSQAQSALPNATPSGLAQPASSPTEGAPMAAPQPAPQASAGPSAPPAPPPMGASAPTALAGAPPPPPPASALPPLTSQRVAGPAVGRTDVTTTMQVPHFLSGEDRAIAAARAKSLGDVRGDLAGYTEMFRASGDPNPEKSAADLVVQEHARRAGTTMPYQSLEIEWVDAAGQHHRELGSFDKATNRYFGSQGTPIQGSVTKAVPYSSLGMGAAVNRAMAELGYTPDEVRTNPGLAMLVNQRAQQIEQADASARTTGTREARGAMLPAEALGMAARLLPNGTLEQQTTLADSLMAATRTATPTPAAAPAQTATPQPDAPAPAAAPAAPAAAPAAVPAAAPKAPAAAPKARFVQGQGWVIPDPDAAAPAAAAPAAPGATPAAPATPGAGGTFGGKVLAGLPAGGGDQSKQTGKPLPAATEKLRVQADATNALVDRALAALKPFSNDNTPAGALRLAAKYRQGIFDPIDSAAEQLSDLAGLQASSGMQMSGGGSRALQFMMQRRLHTPLLPSARQVELYKDWIPAGAIGTASRLLKGDEGTFDTPQMMYQKLLQIKENNKLFLDELQKVTVPSLGVSGPPPAPPR